LIWKPANCGFQNWILPDKNLFLIVPGRWPCPAGSATAFRFVSQRKMDVCGEWACQYGEHHQKKEWWKPLGFKEMISIFAPWF